MLPLITSGASAPFGAMVPIASLTASGVDEVASFVAIPQTYQDLVCVASLRIASGVSSLNVRINQVATSYSVTTLNGDGTAASSTRNSGQNGLRPWATGNSITNSSTIPLSIVVHVLNYRSSSFKTLLCRIGQDLNGSGTTSMAVGLSQVTNPVTGLAFGTDVAGTVFVSGSTFSLYGVRSVGQ